MNHLQNHSEETEAGHERWLVSYADFITLMFAFFTVLYATSEQNSEKTKEFQESIKHYLIKAGGMGSGGTAPTVNMAEKGDTPIEPPIPVYKTSRAESALELDKVVEQIESVLSEAERKKYLIDLTTDDMGIRVSLRGRQLFNGEKLNREALGFLNSLIPILAQTKRRLLIEGFVPKGEKGSYKSPWEFASARTINFLRYVEERYGVEGSRLSALSHGDSVAQSTPSEYADRLEIVLVHEDLDF